MKKQKSGLYRTAVTVAGEKVWLSARTKAELEEKKRQTKERLIYGAPTDQLTFHELVHKWWQDIFQPSGYRDSTIANTRSIVNSVILANTDRRQLAAAVRRADLQRVITAMTNGHNAMRCGKVKGILSSICQYGMELHCMTADYAHNIVIPRDTQPRERRGAIPPDVISRMFDAVEMPFTTTLAVLYYAGLRKGESIALTWADVNFDTCEISVTKSFQSTSRTIGAVKTENSRRTIHMPPSLVDILRRHRGLPSAPVGVHTASAFDYHWTRTLYHAGLATHIEGKPVIFAYNNYDFDYCPHQMRHAYATQLHAAGIDPVTASRLMGHSSYQVTADIYTDIDAKTKNATASAIDDAFAGFADSMHKAK